MMSLIVTDAPERNRFEIHDGDELLGFAEYQRTATMVVFTHTQIDKGAAGRGVGGQLVREALDSVRPTGLKVLPVCPFVQAWLQRHSEYADLDYRNR